MRTPELIAVVHIRPPMVLDIPLRAHYPIAKALPRNLPQLARRNIPSTLPISFTRWRWRPILRDRRAHRPEHRQRKHRCSHPEISHTLPLSSVPHTQETPYRQMNPYGVKEL
jgi:hypothetical protein